MFSRKREQTLLERTTDDAIRSLSNQTVGSGEYMKTLDALDKLHAMKQAEKPSSVSMDTLAIVGANLLGIILIIKHEHVNVIASKAMSLVIKPK